MEITNEMTDKGSENLTEFGMYAETEIKPENEMKPESGSGNGAESKDKSAKKSPWLMILNMVLLVGLVVLYVLYFTGDKKSKDGNTSSLAAYNPIVTNEPGNGDVLYVDLDTIKKYYALVEILTADIESESKRLEASFSNRQQAFQQKVNQFQQNLQANLLTEQQAMNTERMLTNERDQLQYDYESAEMNLQTRQLAALQQIRDSIMMATKIVNMEFNASFVLGNQYGGEVIYADPTKDITKQVIEKLNAYYENRK